MSFVLLSTNASWQGGRGPHSLADTMIGHLPELADRSSLPHIRISASLGISIEHVKMPRHNFHVRSETRASLRRLGGLVTRLDQTAHHQDDCISGYVLLIPKIYLGISAIKLMSLRVYIYIYIYTSCSQFTNRARKRHIIIHSTCSSVGFRPCSIDHHDTGEGSLLLRGDSPGGP